jgi:hypothetical protein
LYFLGVLIAFLTAFLVQKTLLKGKSQPFMIELPLYHWPKWTLIFHSTWLRLKSFLIRAGGIIIPVCLLIGSLNALAFHSERSLLHPNHLEWVSGGSSESILSKVSQAITPVFSPMGIEQENWPATVGLITGALAKEVVIGTLNTLYTQLNNDAEKISERKPLSGLSDWGRQVKKIGTDTWESLKNIPLKSPCDCMLVQRSARDGEFKLMGEALYKLFPRDAAPYVLATVKSDQIERLKISNTARVRVAGEKRFRTGKLVQFLPQENEFTRLKIRLDKSVAPEMFGKPVYVEVVTF